MKWLRSLLGAGEGLLDRVLCVAGAVVFTQVPEFLQQYLQRLGGHVDEARRQLLQFQAIAAQSNLSLETLARQTSANADEAVAKLGGLIAATVDRVHSLETAQSALQAASVWTRPFVFLRHMDPAIARGTWSFFKPAVPTTLEGLVYGLMGMFVLMGLYHGAIKYPLARWSRRRSRKTSAVPAASPTPARISKGG
jgi:hypothetical protein